MDGHTEMYYEINTRTIKIFLLFVGFLIYSVYITRKYDLLSVLFFKNAQREQYYNFQVYNIQKEFKPVYIYKGTEDFLINTTGCFIPNYAKKLKFQNVKDRKKTCGPRAVFIQKNGNYITFEINSKIIKKYYTKTSTYDCCYSFVSRSTDGGKEDQQVKYGKCNEIKNNTTIVLSNEVLTVTCSDRRKKRKKIVYEDSFILLNKIKSNIKENRNKGWNVLMVGMDTMSRARVMSTMPRTVHYLQEQGWLDYRGYQKVGSNTFPNFVAVLTGKLLDDVVKSCQRGLDNCNEYIIWSKFRKAGYITAYGEDYLDLPDTFARYNGFKTQPTHHYMRPLFLTGEQKVGNIICNKKMPSAKKNIDYAYDFAEAYKNDRFFGLFWINSYSHNPDLIPQNFDTEIVNFFKRLNKLSITNNTFIIFYSDHGIRYGDMRLPMESYYEERLPMLYIWTPHEFRQMHSRNYNSLQLNQNRLVTPYDVHATLVEIMNTSIIQGEKDSLTDACPQCTSLFEEKSVNRTCADAGVDGKWCSCHVMNEIDKGDVGETMSVQLVVTHIQKKAKMIETDKCWMCSSLKNNRVLRTHWYQEGNQTYYVVAIEMVPGYIKFEATVTRDYNNQYTIVGPVDTLSSYNTHGNCVKIKRMRPYCMCTRKSKCK